MKIKTKAKQAVNYTLISIILVIIAAVCISLGAADISPMDVVKIVLSKIPLLKSYIDVSAIPDTSFTIVLKVRLPRVILGALIGMNLSTVGATYQGIFKNPMADPFILGISSGASLGAALSIILNFSATPICAFIGAIFTTYLVYSIARVGNKTSTVSLLLSGVAVSFLMSSITSLIMVFYTKELNKIVFWSLGSLSSADTKKTLIVLIVSIPILLIIFSFSRELNIMCAGEDSARNIGVNTENTKKLLLILSSLLVAVSVAFSGVIGFVGLIVPHCIRIIYGPDHKTLLPMSALYGMGFMMVCDALSRNIIPPVEIPIGAITSLFGAPFFIYLLYRNKNKVM